MDVFAKNAKIWRKDIEGRNGTFHKYSVSVSKKNEDGKYVNAYIPVVFSKRANAPEVISNGAECDFTGFMSVEYYTDKEGRTVTTPQVVIMEATFYDGNDKDSVDNFTAATEDFPF